MESTGVFTVAKGALLPGDERARDMWAPGALKIGDKVLVDVHRPRNPEFNAKAHVIFRRIGDAIGQPEDVVKLWLKFETGRVDLIKLPNGKHLPTPHSTAFESMSDDEFYSFWNDALPVIGEKIMPGLPQKEYEELRRIIFEDRKAGAA